MDPTTGDEFPIFPYLQEMHMGTFLTYKGRTSQPMLGAFLLASANVLYSTNPAETCGMDYKVDYAKTQCLIMV